MTEYEILTFIHQNGNIVKYTEVMGKGFSSNKPDLISDDLRIKYLLEEKYIEEKEPLGKYLMLTQKGIIRLDELQQARDDKRNQHIFELILAVISALVGALLSQPLWDWIS